MMAFTGDEASYRDVQNVLSNMRYAKKSALEVRQWLSNLLESRRNLG